MYAYIGEYKRNAREDSFVVAYRVMDNDTCTV